MIDEAKIRVELMQIILEFIEGTKSAQDVLDIGVALNQKKLILKDEQISEVITELNGMNNQILENKIFLSPDMQEKFFVNMLEKLTP